MHVHHAAHIDDEADDHQDHREAEDGEDRDGAGFLTEEFSGCFDLSWIGTGQPAFVLQRTAPVRGAAAQHEGSRYI